MKSSTIISALLLAAAPVVLAAPKGKSGGGGGKGGKGSSVKPKDKDGKDLNLPAGVLNLTPGSSLPAGSCRLIATYNKIIVIGSGGPGQEMVDNDSMGFSIEKGGPNGETRGLDGNTIKSGWQDLSSGLTGLPENISYFSAFNFSTWKPCKASYKGKEVVGKSETWKKDSCGAAGANCQRCTMEFQCS